MHYRPRRPSGFPSDFQFHIDIKGINLKPFENEGLLNIIILNGTDIEATAAKPL